MAALQLTGGAAIGASAIRLNRVKKSAIAIFLHSPGQAFKKALKSISGAGRTYVAAMTCAVVERALRHGVDYAVERENFGRPLIDYQGLRWSLVDVASWAGSGAACQLWRPMLWRAILMRRSKLTLAEKVFGRDCHPKCNRLHASNGCSGGYFRGTDTTVC